VRAHIRFFAVICDRNEWLGRMSGGAEGFGMQVHARKEDSVQFCDFETASATWCSG
jgi:hypothetical protein